MTALSPTMVQSASTHSLVRSSSQQSNLPYAGIGMPLTKSGSRDEEGNRSLILACCQFIRQRCLRNPTFLFYLSWTNISVLSSFRCLL
jgi:hypothetical protein